MGGFPIFFFGFSIFRLVRFRFLIRRSWVTSGGPPFLLFLVDFPFFGGFPVSYFFWFWWVSYFPFFFEFSIFLFNLIGAFLFFPFPPDPPDVHEAQGGNSHPLSFARSWRPGTWRYRSFPRFSIGTAGFQTRVCLIFLFFCSDFL